MPASWRTWPNFGPVTQTKIADHLGQGRAATGATLDRLQERGLVERRPDDDDRRVWQIHLTDAGRDLIRPISAIDETLRTELPAGLSRADRKHWPACCNNCSATCAVRSNPPHSSHRPEPRTSTPAHRTQIEQGEHPCKKQSSSMPSAPPAASATAS